MTKERSKRRIKNYIRSKTDMRINFSRHENRRNTF